MNKTTAIDHFGTQSKLASVLNISQAAVSKWPELVPEKQAIKLSLITGGQLHYDAALYLPSSTEPVSQEEVA